MGWLVLGILIPTAVATAAGLVARKDEDRSARLRHFLTGLAATIGSFLVVAGVMTLNLAAVKKAIAAAMTKSIPSLLNLPDAVSFPMMIRPEQITTGFLLQRAGGAFCVLLLLYLLIFNCRRRARSWYECLGAVIVFGGIFYFCSPWGYYGLGALRTLCLNSDLIDLPRREEVPALLLLTVAIPGVWTFFTIRSNRQGWKRLLAWAGITAGTYAAVWLLALMIAYPYGMYELHRARTMKIANYRMEIDLPPELKPAKETADRFCKRHPDFSLPSEGIYCWTKYGVAQYGGNLVPQKQRDYTLKWFDTPEFERYRAANRAIMEHARDGHVLNLISLNYARNYVRLCVGKAAMYRETGQPDKIIPELEKASVADLQVFKDTPTLIGELVRIAVRSLWCYTVVGVGPDGPQYAPAYRKMLEQVKSLSVRIPSEEGYYPEELESGLRFRGQTYAPNVGAYAKILDTPQAIILAANGFRNIQKHKKIIKELEQREVFNLGPGGTGFPDKKNPTFGLWEQMAVRSRISLVMVPTALALKVYRSEKGHYPKTLDALVPDYLKRIPPNPYDGKPLAYQSDGKNFELSIHNPVQKRDYRITSQPDY